MSHQQNIIVIKCPCNAHTNKRLIKKKFFLPTLWHVVCFWCQSWVQLCCYSIMRSCLCKLPCSVIQLSQLQVTSGMGRRELDCQPQLPLSLLKLTLNIHTYIHTQHKHKGKNNHLKKEHHNQRTWLENSLDCCSCWNDVVDIYNSLCWRFPWKGMEGENGE